MGYGHFPTRNGLKLRKLSTWHRDSKGVTKKLEFSLWFAITSHSSQWYLLILPNYWFYTFKGPKFLMFRVISLLEQYFLLLITFTLIFLNVPILRYKNISLISCYFWHFLELFALVIINSKSFTSVTRAYSVAEWCPHLQLHPTNIQ